MNLVDKLLQLLAGTPEAKDEADKPKTERPVRAGVSDLMTGLGPTLMNLDEARADKTMLDALALDRKEKHGYQGAGERLARYSELAAKGNKEAQEFLSTYGLEGMKPQEIKSWYDKVTEGLEQKAVPRTKREQGPNK